MDIGATNVTYFSERQLMAIIFNTHSHIHMCEYVLYMEEMTKQTNKAKCDGCTCYPSKCRFLVYKTLKDIN